MSLSATFFDYTCFGIEEYFMVVLVFIWVSLRKVKVGENVLKTIRRGSSRQFVGLLW